MAKKKKKLNTKLLKRKLVKKQKEAKKKLHKKFPHAKKYLKKKGFELEDIREKSTELLSLGALTASVILASPTDAGELPIPQEIVEKLRSKEDSGPDSSPQSFLNDILKNLLPKKPRPLTNEEETYLENLLSRFLSLKTKTTLEGQHLNTTYGYIGAEQHLYRYPGDILAKHGSGEIQTAGIAPGLGAWGYFAPSSTTMTPKLENIERWYAVVQTMYLPKWNTDTIYLRDWYKYRKVLIVNTQNANAVIASIADAGPAAWTGKHFGGSPEVMQALGGPRYKKGPVVILFIDDPENNVSLGPIEYNESGISSFALNALTNKDSL